MSSHLSRLVEHRLQTQSSEIKLSWIQRIRFQLWRHGNLSLQDYTMLSLQPRLVARITHPEKISLDDYLHRQLELQALWKSRPLTSPECWKCVLLYDDYSRQLELVRQLAATGNFPAAFLLEVIRANRPDLLAECLKLGAVPTPELLTEALEKHFFEIAELLMQPPYNLRPSIREVLVSGRVDYLDRLGLRELFNRTPFWVHDLARSSPAMLELYLTTRRVENRLLVIVCKEAIELDTPASVEILNYIRCRTSEGSSYVARAIESSHSDLRSLTTLMQGHYSSGLMEVLVEVQIQHDL